MGCGALGETEVRLRVPLPKRVGLPSCVQPPSGIRADGLEHPIPNAARRLDRHEQALLAQRDDVIEDVDAGDLVRLLEIEATDEDRQLREQVLRRRCQQVVAPVDGVVESLVPLRQIAIPMSRQRLMPGQPLSDRSQWQGEHPRCCELDPQWQTVQRDTDAGDVLRFLRRAA